jgi:hypothetical protein
MAEQLSTDHTAHSGLTVTFFKFALCLLGSQRKGAVQKTNGERLSSHTWKAPLIDSVAVGGSVVTAHGRDERASSLLTQRRTIFIITQLMVIFVRTNLAPI